MLSIRFVAAAALLMFVAAPASAVVADESDGLTIVNAPSTVSYGTPWTIEVLAQGSATVGTWGAVHAAGASDQGANIAVVEETDEGTALTFTPYYTLPVGTWDVTVSASALGTDGSSIELRSTNSVTITVTPVTVTPEVTVVKSGASVSVTAGLPGLITNVADAGSWVIVFTADGQVVHSLTRVGLETGPLTIEWYPPLPGTEYDVRVEWHPLSTAVIATPVTRTFVSDGTRPAATSTPTRSATPTATPTPTRSSSPVPNPSGTTSAAPVSPVTAGGSPLPVVFGIVAALVGIAAAVVGILYVRRRAAVSTPETENADQPES